VQHLPVPITDESPSTVRFMSVSLTMKTAPIPDLQRPAASYVRLVTEVNAITIINMRVHISASNRRIQEDRGTKLVERLIFMSKEGYGRQCNILRKSLCPASDALFIERLFKGSLNSGTLHVVLP